jgi:hypothetical protein
MTGLFVEAQKAGAQRAAPFQSICISNGRKQIAPIHCQPPGLHPVLAAAHISVRPRRSKPCDLFVTAMN